MGLLARAIGAKPTASSRPAWITAYVAIAATIAGDTMFSGDSFRPTLAWLLWSALAIVSSAAAIWFMRGNFAVIRSMPIELNLFLGLLAASTFWSAYWLNTLIGLTTCLQAVIVALFLAANFDWRELLKIFANVIRVILIVSFAIEIYAATFANGQLGSLFNSSGQNAVLSQGNLFAGQRIQGIVANSNLLAAIALIGVIVFAVELFAKNAFAWQSISSLTLSVAAIVLSKSAGIVFASVAVLLAAVVSLFAEGKNYETRHRIYRITWVVTGVVMFFVLSFRREVFDILGKSPDMTHRTYIWKRVFSLFQQRPFEGWGFTGVWQPGVHPFENLIVINGQGYFQAHNAYLDVLLQVGLVGFVLFAIVLVRTFVRLWRLAVHHSSSLYLWPLLVLVAELVRAITESRLIIESAFMILILFAVKATEPDELLEARTGQIKLEQLQEFGRTPITKAKIARR